MPDGWEEVRRRELAEEYPAAIGELERLLKADPDQTEVALHLGFDYWLAITEADRLSLTVPARQYARRFLELLSVGEPKHGQHADFCWANGLPLSLHYHFFAKDGTNSSELDRLKALGERLLHNAATLDVFYARLQAGQAAQEEIARRFAGRGSLARYYGVV